MFDILHRKSGPDRALRASPYNAEPPLRPAARQSSVTAAIGLLRAQPWQRAAASTRARTGCASYGRVGRRRSTCRWQDLRDSGSPSRTVERGDAVRRQPARGHAAGAPTSGDPWAPGAIGNARWSGVSLADVLRAAGAETGAGCTSPSNACDRVRDAEAKTLPLRRLDPDGEGDVAGRSAGLCDERGGAGTGARLPAARGGARVCRRAQPEMAAAITVQDRPSDNHMQQRDYKLCRRT